MTTTNEVSVSDAMWDTKYDSIRTVKHAIEMASAAARAGDLYQCQAWMLDAGGYYKQGRIA